MTTRTRTIAAALALLGFLLGLFLLRGEAPWLAELTARSGASVEASGESGRARFSQAEPGRRFGEGDRLRTGSGASARVHTRSGTDVRLGADTVVRFTATSDPAPEALGLALELGEATLHTDGQGARVHTHVGLAVLEPGSEVTLKRTDDGLAFAVAVGTLRFTDDGGHERVLAAREGLAVGIGMAVLERPSREPRVRVEVEGGSVIQRRGAEPAQMLTPGPHNLAAGSLLKVGEGSSVRVQSDAGDVLLEAPGSYRLAVHGSLVETLVGSVRVLAQRGDVRVAVPGGAIVARGIDGGSEAALAISAAAFELLVTRGQVEAARDGQSWTLGAGEALHLPERIGAAGGPTLIDSLPFAHLRVPAGESFVVHAPGVPIAIGFDSRVACAAPFTLELGDRLRVRGEAPVSAAFHPGATPYQLRCGKQVVGRGRIQVLLDAGTRKLPSRAPSAEIDADGRSYNVHYQNQLPELRVHWPNAPSQGPYEVSVDGERTSCDAPSYVYKSGKLGDGAHEFVWSAGKRRSRPARVQIVYDSSAPTASLSAPEDRGFAIGDRVTVRGEAVRAFQVALGNGTIERDADDRFTGARVTDAGAPDIVVRLSHPRRGVHYYVRRSVESP